MPLGLTSPIRQQRLVQGIRGRCAQAAERREQLEQRHALEQQALAERLSVETSEQQQTAEQQRIAVLSSSDASDESAVAAYERQSLSLQQRLVDLSIKMRKAIAAGRSQLEQERQRAVQELDQAQALQREQIPRQLERELERLRGTRAPIEQLVEQGRALALRRLGRLSDAELSGPGPEQAARYGVPFNDSQDQAQLRQMAAEILARMRQNRIAAWTETYRFPLWMLVIAASWLVGCWWLSPKPLLVWGLGGLIGTVLMGTVLYLAALPGLRRHTRRWLPVLEALNEHSRARAQAAEHAPRVSAAQQLQRLQQEHQQARNDLLSSFRKREAAFEEQHRAEQNRQRGEVQERMRQTSQEYAGASQRVESELQTALHAWQQSRDQLLADLRSRHESLHAQLCEVQTREKARLLQRTETALLRAVERIRRESELAEASLPPYASVREGIAAAQKAFTRLPVARRSVTADPPAIDASLSVVVDHRLHAGLLLDVPPAQSARATQLVIDLAARLLAGMQPGRVRFLLCDALGRGESLAPLLVLADHDPQLVSHRIWTRPEQIEQRLNDLTHHVETVVQTQLRDRYRTLAEYNEEAGTLAEPYRAVVLLGAPHGLTAAAAAHLQGLAASALRAGLILIIVREDQQPWPTELTRLQESQWLHLRMDDGGRLWHTEPGLDDSPLVTDPGISGARLTKMLDDIGQAAVAAARVSVPFDEVLSSTTLTETAADSAAGLAIPLGRLGAQRTQWLRLGSATQQHVLVAGKTGSGKSNLLHVLITGAAVRYGPDQVQLYLLDFKKGVEFKPYADLPIPHVRVIGIESEREFGHSVLQRLDGILTDRGSLFRGEGVSDLSAYRRQTGQAMPRILLVIDEFQELFVRDDRLAQDGALLLDRLVRQGRSFGIHVVLASQSLAGAYSLPRATLGQMAIRIALASSEADAAAILADDNPSARLLNRPGEAIYNDSGGLIEGNQPFQVAWLSSDVQREHLSQLRARYTSIEGQWEPPVIFEGHRPARWQSMVLLHPKSATGWVGICGEAVAIGPPVTLELSPQPGRNVLLVSHDDGLRQDLLATYVTTLLADCPVSERSPVTVQWWDGRREQESPGALRLIQEAGIPLQVVRPRDCGVAIREAVKELEMRLTSSQAEPAARRLMVIDGLDRFRELRHDDSAAFSFEPGPPQPAQLFQRLLRDGPAVNLYCLLAVASAESIHRWLPRASLHDFESRLLGQMNGNDSAQLMDAADASRLSPATMLLYDDATGSIKKFRVFGHPSAQELRGWWSSQQPLQERSNKKRKSR